MTLNTNLNQTLIELSEEGVKLWLDGEKLGIRAPKGVLTPERIEILNLYKPEIISLLRQKNIGTVTDALPQIRPEPDKRYEPFPLTDMQYAFWIGRMGVLEFGDVANHGYYEIEGEGLNLERLNWALQQLIERHDMLKAIMLPDGKQVILKKVPLYKMKVLDLRGENEEIINRKIEEIREELSHQVLPYDHFPLFEFRATLLDNEKIRLHISYDLQIFDAWSMFRLFDEWFQLCHNAEKSLPPLSLSFRDYVLAEKSIEKTQLYTISKEYWLNRVDTLPPAPQLPLATNPSSIKYHHCQRFSGYLDVENTQKLKQKASQAGITISALLLTAFAEILTLWTTNPRFTINLALFNRLPLHPEVNNILGDFTSVTLLEVNNSKLESFKNRAIRLQKQLWQDLEHRYFSGVKVMRELNQRKGGIPVAMPIVFTSVLGFESLGQETSALSQFGKMVYGISQASQVWLDHQVSEQQGVLTFTWDVVKGLFPEGLIDDMFESYCRLLRQLVASDATWEKTRRNLIPSHQLAQREAINNTENPIPNQLLHTFFEKQVELRENELAIISPQKKLTYKELDELSNGVGHYLRDRGIQPNQLVAVVMEKGWEQIVAVLGILKAGGAYLPIDSSLPQERLSYLLEDGEVEFILTQSWIDSKINWKNNITTICIDKNNQIKEESYSPIDSIQNQNDLAFVIYTSGSTGLPKGVKIAHKGIVNAIVHTNKFLALNSNDRILALTALHHDMSLFDIFGLLSAGGSLVIPDASQIKNANHWAELMSREKVTIWNSVPPMMEMLLEYGSYNSESLPQSLRWAILGGDKISLTLPKRLDQLIKDVSLLSVGGPTETTMWNIWYLVETVDSSWKSIPYGKPIANTKYYILNEALEDCPIWVTGEICCSGIGLAKGYWRNQEKTRTSFVSHPRTGERIYRTGDLGRYLPDGNIEILGRVDFQIKIRGHRIEAGEIEAALVQHPKVMSCLVQAIENQHLNKKQLAAYIITEKDLKPTQEELNQFIKDKVPEYMIPSLFIFLDKFPLTSNGKVDRKALLNQTELLNTEEITIIPPNNELEEKIAKIWQQVLGLERVGINNNFFDLGGNSLLVTKIFNELQQELPELCQGISVVELFKYQTIKELVQYLSRQNNDNLVKENTMEIEKQMTKGKNRLKEKRKRSKRIRFY